MNNQKFNTQLIEVTKALLSALPKRTRDIMEKRFGLFKKEARTLEAIGQDYGITRERVRQIEERALKELQTQIAVNPKLAGVFEKMKSEIANLGNVRREDRLLADFGASEEGMISFLLTMHPDFSYIPDNDAFHARWFTDPKALKQSEKVVDAIASKLREQASVMTEDQFSKLAKGVASTFGTTNEPAVFSYVDTSKNISKNNFGEYGLVSWPEIKPRGLRDKAYIVLKRMQKPLHFREVAKAIEAIGLHHRSVHPQTVHNELIRDGRFVLVGRGLYALADWGYPAGTVKDIIKSILKANGPLQKEALLQQVMEKRFVKENTILLNLQNKSLFRKLEDGRYHVKEA